VATRYDNKHVKEITYLQRDTAKEVQYAWKCGNEVWEREQRKLFRHQSICLPFTRDRVSDL